MSLLKAVIYTLIVSSLAGCATGASFPRTREQFVTMYGSGGLFHNAEHFTVNRQANAVIADARNYASRCLDIKKNVKRASRYKLNQYGPANNSEPVTYNTKIEKTRSGATALSVQELGIHTKDDPPGGKFTLVAEIQAMSSNKTRISLYHLSRAPIANPLRQWMQGGEHVCPAL